jgi:hypothetical protein
VREPFVDYLKVGIDGLQRLAVGDHHGRIAPEHRAGDGCGRGTPLQGEQRPLRKRQQRRARLFLERPGGGLERAHRFRKQRDLSPAREHGRGVIQRPVRVADRQRNHAERMGERGDLRERDLVRAGDARGRALQGVGRRAGHHGAQGVHRARTSACPYCRVEDRDRQPSGEMDDELPRDDQALIDELRAQLRHCSVGDRE